MRHRRRRLHGDPPGARREGDDDRRSRDGSGRDGPGLLLENGTPLPFNAARYSGLSVGVPGTVATWDEALDALRHDVPRGGARAGDPRRAGRLRGRPDVCGQTHGNLDFFDDIPATAALYLDPTARHVTSARCSVTPTSPRTYERDRAARARRASTAGPWRAHRRDRAAPAGLADREPRLAAGRDDDARPAHLQRARARADARGLPRAGRLRHGSAVERRLDGRRGAQHPRGLPALDLHREGALHDFLEASRFSFADRNAYLGRLGLLRRAAARACSRTASRRRGGR